MVPYLMDVFEEIFISKLLYKSAEKWTNMIPFVTYKISDATCIQCHQLPRSTNLSLSLSLLSLLRDYLCFEE